MALYRTFIQQLSYDGTSYTKGAVKETLSDFNIGCIEFPFKMLGSAKELVSRDWPGENGKDVYVPPSGIPIQDYDLEVDFLYKGTVDSISTDMTAFIAFLLGKNSGATGARLCIYDENVGFGRKDVVLTEIDPEMYSAGDYDPDALFNFKAKFHVYDPWTAVSLTKDKSGNVTDLSFKTA